MQETQVWSLDWEDPLEKEMASHSGILAWRNPMDRGAWWAAVRGVTESWTQLCHYTTIIGTIGTIIILFWRLEVQDQCCIFLCRFPSGLHSEVWNQGHLDVVCAPPLQGEPHPGPSGHWGSGRCGEGKAGNLLYSWHSTYKFNFSPQFNFYNIFLYTANPVINNEVKFSFLEFSL